MTLALAGCTSAPMARMPQSDVLSHLQATDGTSLAPGNVELHVEPGDAEVEVDGVEVGQASDFDGVHGCLQLSSGPHQVVVEKQGFQPADLTVYAGTDGRQRLNLELSRSP